MPGPMRDGYVFPTPAAPKVDFTKYVTKQGTAQAQARPAPMTIWDALQQANGVDGLFGGGSSGGSGGYSRGGGGGGGGGGAAVPALDLSDLAKQRDSSIDSLNKIYKMLGGSISKSKTSLKNIKIEDGANIRAIAKQAGQEVAVASAANNKERDAMRAALGLGDAAAVTNDTAGAASSDLSKALRAFTKDSKRANSARYESSTAGVKTLNRILGIDLDNQKESVQQAYDDAVAQAKEEYAAAVAKSSGRGGGRSGGGYSRSGGYSGGGSGQNYFNTLTAGRKLDLALALYKEQQNAYTGQYGAQDFMGYYNNAPAGLTDNQRVNWADALNGYIHSAKLS